MPFNRHIHKSSFICAYIIFAVVGSSSRKCTLVGIAQCDWCFPVLGWRHLNLSNLLLPCCWPSIFSFLCFVFVCENFSLILSNCLFAPMVLWYYAIIIKFMSICTFVPFYSFPFAMPPDSPPALKFDTATLFLHILATNIAKKTKTP